MATQADKQTNAPRTVFSTLAAYMEGARIARAMDGYFDDQGDYVDAYQARGETLMAMACNIKSSAWMPHTRNAARALANALEHDAGAWLAKAGAQE